LTRATYDRLFALADDRLAVGEPVVLDATFLDAAQRARAADLAQRHGARLILLETVCDEATVAARLAARAQQGRSVSDASFATYLQQRAATTESPPPVPPQALCVQVSTEGPLPISLEDIWTSLARADLVPARVPPVRVDQREELPKDRPKYSQAALAPSRVPIRVRP
jgi:hypothetical protein